MNEEKSKESLVALSPRLTYFLFRNFFFSFFFRFPSQALNYFRANILVVRSKSFEAVSKNFAHHVAAVVVVVSGQPPQRILKQTLTWNLLYIAECLLIFSPKSSGDYEFKKFSNFSRSQRCFFINQLLRLGCMYT